MAKTVHKTLRAAYLSTLFLVTWSHAGNIEPISQAPVDSVTVDRLLAGLGRTQETVSYSGVQVRTVTRNDRVVELRWREHHWQPDQTLVTFLGPEELSGSQFVVNGDRVRQLSDARKDKALHYYHHSKRLLKNGRIFKEIALLHRNYEVEAEEGPNFLGQATISLRITPRHAGRPSLTALVDAHSGLLLRSKRWNGGTGSERLAESSEFVEISYEEPAAVLFADAWAAAKPMNEKREAKTYSDVAALMADVNRAVLEPKIVPRGFTLSRVRSVRRKDKAFLHFLYGDGLSFVSLFQRPIGGNKSGTEEHRRKRHHQSPWLILRGEQAGIAYSIAGEIPEEELAEMAASLEPIAPGKQKWHNLPFYIALALILVSMFSYVTKRRREKMYA